MKNWYLLFLILFFMSSGAFATSMFPDTVQTGPAVIRTNSREVTDYNVALRKKLEADYDKKYLHVNKDGTYGYYDAPLGAYEKEVVIPYALNSKPDDYKIISK